MGLRDRILDYVAKVFMPVPDHPARGGMTGEARGSEENSDEESEADGADGEGTSEQVSTGDG